MRSHADRGVHRLLTLKEAQMRMARSAALAQAQHALDKRNEAAALREQAHVAVDGAVPLPEQGLTRIGLYDRLRTLAVARAHALEMEQSAGELEVQATACDTQQRAFQTQALEHQRKQSKLDHWHRLHNQAQARVRLQRQQQQHVEDMSCRPPQRR